MATPSTLKTPFFSQSSHHPLGQQPPVYLFGQCKEEVLGHMHAAGDRVQLHENIIQLFASRLKRTIEFRLTLLGRDREFDRCPAVFDER